MTEVLAAEPLNRRHFQQIMAGLTEGVLFIETDRRIVWANEAALRMHGADNTEALGGTVEDYGRRFTLRYRNGQLLAPEAHPLQRLCAGEAFNELIVETRRADDPEADWVHTLRGFTLVDASGEPDLHVLVLADHTERFEAEDRFERMFNANPAPALIVRVSDLRYVRVNHGFMEMTGYKSRDLVGRTLYEFDVLEGVKEREFARTRLSTWLPVPQMEGELRLPGGDDKLVLVAGHPIEVSDQRCMLFTFADLEPRRRAENALRQSEERFAKSFRLAPAPMKLASLKDFRLIGVNHAFAQATGWSADELVGRSSAEVELWDSADTRRAVEKQLVETGTLRGVEVQLRTKKGWTIPCLASAETMLIDGEQCVLTVLQDISERKRTENELVAAVEAALQDSTWLSRGILDKLANVRALGGGAPAMTVSAAPEALTTRERDVLALIARGRNDKAIADALGLSTTTVRNHVARLYGKLGVHSRAEAVIWARERGYGSEPA